MRKIDYSDLRWNGNEYEIYAGYPLGHVSLNAEIDKLEQYREITSGISLDRLREICDAERDNRCVVLPNKECYAQAGNTLYLVDDGDIIEVMHCGAQIDADGRIHAVVAANDKIFPYRQPDPEHDTDPTEWCAETKEITPDDFDKTVFLTRAEAEAALRKEQGDETHN